MRTIATLLVVAAALLPACVEADDDGEGSGPDTAFAGTWEATRTTTGTQCAHDFRPRSTVRVLIEGDSESGYTAVEAFNVGTPGNPGTLAVVAGVTRLATAFQEYWPGFGSQPDVAPGVGFVLWIDGAGLAGTSHANAYYSVDGELVPCMYDFTLTATRIAPGA